MLAGLFNEFVKARVLKPLMGIKGAPKFNWNFSDLLNFCFQKIN